MGILGALVKAAKWIMIIIVLIFTIYIIKSVIYNSKHKDDKDFKKKHWLRNTIIWSIVLSIFAGMACFFGGCEAAAAVAVEAASANKMATGIQLASKAASIIPVKNNKPSGGKKTLSNHIQTAQNILNTATKVASSVSNNKKV